MLILLLAATLAHDDIRPESLPRPFATPSAGNPPVIDPRPRDVQFTAPPRFRVALFAEGFQDPRSRRVLGRPVTDDGAGVIWRVTYQP